VPPRTHLYRILPASAAALAFLWAASAADVATFDRDVKPFLKQNCVRCHNVDTAMSGVRVDQLDASLEDRHLHLWETIRKKVGDESMPPKGQPQPTGAERQRLLEWIGRSLDIARSRPAPKNGLVRRLTVAQYRNTLRELLHLEDDLTETLPPDAVSKDGFVNNKDTLQLSPLQLETYLDIAGEALERAIVDPASKPAIQAFRMDLGASINPSPFPEELILGANSLLLDNKDFTVTEPAPAKPFAFDHRRLRTNYRFIEGYQGNDTVRGWREYSSIYHSVFACMRGSRGYPKGLAYSAAPEGLLLRPAIPNDELFQADGTYGPKANFKVSLRELPDNGRFRVTVTAAKYDDGLLLDSGAPAQAYGGTDSVVATDPAKPKTIAIPRAGAYQVDVYAAPRIDPAPFVDSTRLSQGLGWTIGGSGPAAKLVDSPVGKAVSVDGKEDALVVPRDESMDVGTGDFTVSAWINPRPLKKAGIVSLGAYNWSHGWYLDMPDNKGIVRLETSGPDNMSNGSVASPPGVVRPNTWQHVAAVVRRGRGGAVIYVNGYPVARGDIGKADLDNPKMNLHIGRMPGAQQFRGQIAEVRIHRRALDEAEVQGLVEPGRRFVRPPPDRPREITLNLGDRQFSGTLQQPAFLALRLPAGELKVGATHTGVTGLDRIVMTPLAPDHEVARRLAVFEKRSPKLGVHLGFRRDCGSTFAPVGSIQVVSGTQPKRFVFEGAIRNYPNPEVENDNVNYLAGVREIAVRSEYTDGRDMPRLAIRSVEFEGPYYDQWPPQTHRAIFIDSPSKGDTPAYARQVVRSFAARAYRRPISAAEEASLMGVFQKSMESKRGFRDSVKDTLQVVLTSPQFLFLTETSATPGPEPLDSHELASKLSYFLWNGPPDATTLRLAANGTLRARLDSEVARLMADAKFSRFVREFGSQWLALDKFHVLEPDKARYPKLTRDTRAHLKQEPLAYLEHALRNNLPVRNLVDADYIVANEVVAGYYDLGAKSESGFDYMAIPHGRRELGGLMTQAAILAGLSDGRESNPVKRGAWLARRIIAEPPDDPPPNVPALKEETKDLTLRQRLEQHRNQPGCAQCHSKIDPWGVALEEFDAGGRLKAKPVDARSKLPDSTEVGGINDLKRYLGQDRIDQVAFSVLKHLAVYANGRNLAYSELAELKRDALKLKPGGYRMQDLVRYVAGSRMFLEK
jgi:mono/diheme cytochrome c family protein